MRRPLHPILVLAAALSLALGGCGSSGSSAGNGVASKSPEQIVEAAKAAADSAASAHVAGTVTSEGKQLSLDMELLAGKGGKGRITIAGQPIDLVRTSGAVYIKAGDAFYRAIAGPAAAALLRGKWLKASETGGNFASLASLTDLAKMIGGTLAAHGKLARGGETTVQGTRVVGVKDLSKGGTLFVATTGTPFPIELAQGGTSGGHIVFDRWNKPVEISAPANAININQLQSGH